MLGTDPQNYHSFISCFSSFFLNENCNVKIIILTVMNYKIMQKKIIDKGSKIRELAP